MKVSITLEFDENNLLDELYRLTKDTDVYYRLTQDYGLATEAVQFKGSLEEIALVAMRWFEDDCGVTAETMRGVLENRDVMRDFIRPYTD